MLRTYLYIPDELEDQIIKIAKITKKSKASVIREALQKGLESMVPDRSPSAKPLLAMAKASKDFPGSAPVELSKDHDK